MPKKIPQSEQTVTTETTTRPSIPPCDTPAAQASAGLPDGRKDLAAFLSQLRLSEQERARERARLIRRANRYGEFSVTLLASGE